MSMFKRMLASAGIGAAEVNLMLHQDVVKAGDTLSGVVRIQGGRVDQKVDDVYAFVKTRYVKEHNDSKSHVEATIAKFLLASGFTVEAEQVYEFPVSFQLPSVTPVTMGKTPSGFIPGLISRKPLILRMRTICRCYLIRIQRLFWTLQPSLASGSARSAVNMPLISAKETAFLSSRNLNSSLPASSAAVWMSWK